MCAAYRVDGRANGGPLVVDTIAADSNRQKKLLIAKIERAMAKRNMSQAELARTMSTGRTVIHRLLDPRDTSVTLATLSKASKALGVKLLKVA